MLFVKDFFVVEFDFDFLNTCWNLVLNIRERLDIMLIHYLCTFYHRKSEQIMSKENRFC